MNSEKLKSLSISVKFLTKSGCTLCDRGLFLMRRVKQTYPFLKFELIDISRHPEYQKFRQSIPVVLINETMVCSLKLEERKIREHINLLIFQAVSQNP